MDSSDATLYSQKIEEFVYDNDDIITPTVLSAQLDIKVNDARSLMEQYVRDARQCRADDLALTYVLIGTNEEGIISIAVVKETELEEKRRGLKTVISEQIYSVQRSKDIELNTLAILEPIGALSIREKPLLGSIVSTNAVKRELKTKTVQTAPTVKKEDEVNLSTKPDTNALKCELKTKTVQSSTKLDTKTSNKQNQKNGSISSFLSKDTSNAISKPSVKAKPTPKNLMANFLSKTLTKATANSKTEEIVKNDIKRESEQKVEAVNVKETTAKEIREKMIKEELKYKLIDSESDEDAPPPKKTKQTPRRKPKKKRSTKDKGDRAPKRRRIVSQDDSDSEDIFQSDNDREMEDKDVVVSDQEAPPPKQQLPSNRKVRKVVSEMVQDDDGYFKTVNKFVYESGLGNEGDEKRNDGETGEPEDKENKKQVPNNSPQPKAQDEKSKKKNASPVKAVKNGKGKAANQASIMSFFKKK